MNAYKIETTLSEDGALLLQGLPFHMGDAVEVIILERSGDSLSETSSSRQEKAGLVEQKSELYPLQGKQPYRYDDPFEPATALEDWEVLK
jgi:hypothetical protein